MIQFPAHKCGLSLEHNEHKGYYQSAEAFINERDMAGDFATPEAMKKAIDTDELWVLQWYPETPIGFIVVAGSTLDEVLALALQAGAA